MRDVLQILAVAALVLVFGLAGWWYLGTLEQADPLLVQQLVGPVDAVRGGVRAPAQVGETLGEADRILTGEGARAVLGLGEGTRLELGEDASVRVLGRGEQGLRLELEGGRVQATVRADSERVAITAAGRTVSAQDADFAVGLSGDGVLAVEASRGQAALEGFGLAGPLEAGQQVVVTADGAERLGPVPSSLLLAVQWPEQALTREGAVRVQGRTSPGARVQVLGGASAVAGPDGVFELEILLAEGENQVEVEARDPMGRVSRTRWTMRRDSTGPTGEFEIPF